MPVRKNAKRKRRRRPSKNKNEVQDMIDTVLASMNKKNPEELSWKEKVDDSIKLLFISDIIQFRINKLNLKNNIVIGIWLFIVSMILTLKLVGVI